MYTTLKIGKIKLDNDSNVKSYLNVTLNSLQFVSEMVIAILKDFGVKCNF